MTRLRFVLGSLAAALMILSSAAHSLLGWKALSAELAKTGASPDLVQGLALGWHFGGAAMLTFGIVVLLILGASRRGPARGGPAASLLPALVIAVAYLLFGAGALVASRFDPFFLVFIVPGTLLLLASWPSRGAA